MRKLLITIFAVALVSVSDTTMVIQNNMRNYIKPIASASGYVTRGILAYYKFDETSGTNANEEINNYDGTLHGGAGWSASGHLNGCVSLGANDDVALNNAIVPADNFSIEMWLKFASGTPYVFAVYPATTRMIIQCLNDGDGTGRVMLDIGGTASTYVDVGSNDFTVFTHLVVTRSGSSMQVYLNNTKYTGTCNTGNVSADTDNVVNIATLGMSGFADELRIYNVVLTDAEVAQNYAL